MKKILNKNYTIYRIDAKKLDQHQEITIFKDKLIDNFSGLSPKQLIKKYGLNYFECGMLHIRKMTGLLYGNYGESKRWFIIPNEEVKLLEFFNTNAPLHLLKKRKVLYHLRTYVEDYLRFDNDFQNQMKFYEISDETREKLKPVWERHYCNGCEEMVDDVDDYYDIDLCDNCEEIYDNVTGYCSLSCCVGNGCDQSC